MGGNNPDEATEALSKQIVLGYGPRRKAKLRELDAKCQHARESKGYKSGEESCSAPAEGPDAEKSQWKVKDTIGNPVRARLDPERQEGRLAESNPSLFKRKRAEVEGNKTSINNEGRVDEPRPSSDLRSSGI